MPELPEVESLRRGLERLAAGQTIKKVEVSKPKLVSGRGNARQASSKKVAEFVNGLTGEKIKTIDRRAKNLIFRFSSGKLMLVHLKMSGQFIYREHGKNLVVGGHPIESAENGLPDKHTHVIFHLSRGTLFYNDTRMFGYLIYYPDESNFLAENHFEKTGIEPMDPVFTAEYLYEKLKKKSGRLKAVLMGQEVVAGLGNIYADEAAFEAGIRPTRPARSLTRKEVDKLHAAIRRIISRAIELGGSSVATYRLLDDSRGNYAREHKVYGKAGEKCPVCGKPFRKMVVAGRTTVFCSRCQK